MPKKDQPNNTTAYNPFFRMHEPTKAGVVLMIKQKKEIVLKQFDPGNAVPDGIYRPLDLDSLLPDPAAFDSEKENRDPEPVIGYTPNGRTKMKASRSIDIEVTDANKNVLEQGKLLFFSPDRTKKSKPALRKATSAATNDTKDKTKGTKRRRENTDRFSTLPTPSIKGGEPLFIKPDRKRRKKAASNLSTMGISSRNAVLAYLEKNKDKYEMHVYAILQQLVKISNLEWLHGYGKGLKPVGIEIQHPNNLGSAPDFINSFMMVLEILAKFFASQFPVAVCPKFTMLEESQIIQHVHYELTVQRDGKTYALSNNVNAIALCNKENWPSYTDAALAKITLEGLMTQQVPALETRMKAR